MMRRRLLPWLLMAPALAWLAHAPHALASRDAAFADPGSMNASSGGDAVVVEPKGDVDTGESVVNIARRTTLFFANKTNVPVEVSNVTTNDDGNVKSSVVSDDCSREKKIGAGSRCSIVIETTPSNAGAWTAEVLLTHKGAGRIARAKLTGKASGQFSAEKKEAGFALSTKDVKPIDFGDVEVNSVKIVRTALMINDSPETITLLSIDVIAAENGLERLDQGCVIDMELKPGESCPVTLVWKPAAKGLISTDLIIRHSGRLGFAVIPIRGNAKDGMGAEIRDAKATVRDGKAAGSGKKPTAADELDKIADKIPPLTPDVFPADAMSGGGSPTAPVFSGEFRLIGTVGNRAVLLKPDGATAVVAIGEEIPYGNKTAKLTNVMPKAAEIFLDGNKKRLTLMAASELTSKAAGASSKDAARPEMQRFPTPPSPGSAGK